MIWTILIISNDSSNGAFRKRASVPLKRRIITIANTDIDVLRNNDANLTEEAFPAYSGICKNLIVGPRKRPCFVTSNKENITRYSAQAEKVSFEKARTRTMKVKAPNRKREQRCRSVKNTDRTQNLERKTFTLQGLWVKIENNHGSYISIFLYLRDNSGLIEFLIVASNRLSANVFFVGWYITKFAPPKEAITAGTPPETHQNLFIHEASAKDIWITNALILTWFKRL